MNKVKSLDDLKKMRERLQSDLEIRENSNDPESIPQIKVSMGTCGIASGAKEVMSLFISGLKERNIDAVVTQTGCMGHCNTEPTVEITLPGNNSIVYGEVTPERVAILIDKYIVGGELAEGIIPDTHNTSF